MNSTQLLTDVHFSRLYEWILLKCEKAELHFTFLGQTLDLIVLFENDEKIKDIQLNSELSGTA